MIDPAPVLDRTPTVLTARVGDTLAERDRDGPFALRTELGKGGGS